MALSSTDKITKLDDIIEPETFADYVIDKTAEKSEIMYAGAIRNNPLLDKLITGGGTIMTAPAWQDLDGESQVLNDTDAIEVSNISAKAEMFTMMIRAKAWGAHDLAGAFAGDDPMKAIANRTADWWIRDEKKTVLAVLEGIFTKWSETKKTAKGYENPVYENLILDEKTAKIDAGMVLDGKQLLGDAADQLSLIYMHSATYTELQKQNVIEFIPQAESKINIPTFLGYKVITDDSAPVTGTGSSRVFTTYLLAEGCLQRGMGKPVSLVPVETDREKLMSTSVLINRQAKALHPKGISWEGNGNIGSNPTPSNTDMKNGDNWCLATELKKIGIVKILHKVAA